MAIGLKDENNVHFLYRQKDTLIKTIPYTVVYALFSRVCTAAFRHCKA